VADARAAIPDVAAVADEDSDHRSLCLDAGSTGSSIDFILVFKGLF
jgi:hypothetical protein